MIVQERLTLSARAAVRSLLDPGQSLTDIANWADEQRQKPGSGRRHYVDVPIDEPRYDARYCSPRGCLVSMIAVFRRVLQDADAPRAERQIALAFLLHLVEGLHQPPHVGDNADRDGNQFQVRSFGTRTNCTASGTG